MSHRVRHPRTLGIKLTSSTAATLPDNDRPSPIWSRGSRMANQNEAAARAAVLGRLWGALAREPIPGVVGRAVSADTLVVRLADGRHLRGPAPAAAPFALPPVGLSVELDGAPHADPAVLLAALDAGPHTARLASELANSVANLALAPPAHPNPDRGPPALVRYAYAGHAAGNGLADLEQCVVDGHPLHPLCRTRLGMSTVEGRRYAPEHRPRSEERRLGK